MTATTAAAVHTFTASAEDRRRCTCGKSRNTSVHGYDKNARAAAKAAPADAAAVLPPLTAEEVRSAPVFAALTEGAREVLARHAEQPDARVTEDRAELAVIAERAALLDAMPTEEEPVTLAEVRADLLPSVQVDDAELLDALDAAGITVAEEAPAPAVSGWNNPHAKAPAVLPSQLRKAEKAPAAPRGRKVEPGTRALWVARELVAIILESTDPAHAVIVRKLSAVIPNNRGGRTIRLTEAEAELLSGMATEIETAVLDASVQADGAGRLARSCVTMRARLAALWA